MIEGPTGPSCGCHNGCPTGIIINNYKMNNQLVLKNSLGKDVTTSLIVAKVFGKDHRHVLRDINELTCSEGFRKTNFGLSYYKSSQGKQIPMYEITKDGFSFLAMGYTGIVASGFKELFIAAFNQNEELLKSEEYILNRGREILAGRIKALEQAVVNRNYIIAEQHPKAVYHDKVLRSKGTCTSRVLGKELKLTAQQLHKILHEKKIIYPSGGGWLMYEKYQAMGYMKSDTYLYKSKDGKTEGTRIQSRWTEKGRRFVHMVIDEELRKKTNTTDGSLLF